jgi:hypothetical protein
MVQTLNQAQMGKARHDLRKTIAKQKHIVGNMKRAISRQYYEQLAEEAALSAQLGGKFKDDVNRLLDKKNKKLKLATEKEGLILNEKVMADKIIESMKTLFSGDAKTRVLPFTGLPTSLMEPITMVEVKRASRKMRNNKTTGDGFPAEIFKEGGNVLHQMLAELFNDMLTMHKDITSMHSSIFHMLNKPRKAHTIDHMRPIQLLNAVRKLY